MEEPIMKAGAASPAKLAAPRATLVRTAGRGLAVAAGFACMGAAGWAVGPGLHAWLLEWFPFALVPFALVGVYAEKGLWWVVGGVLGAVVGAIADILRGSFPSRMGAVGALTGMALGLYSPLRAVQDDRGGWPVIGMTWYAVVAGTVGVLGWLLCKPAQAKHK